ncbi:MAG: choice-of-anchor D domain-containing protein [Bacteroidota bacterium]
MKSLLHGLMTKKNMPVAVILTKFRKHNRDLVFALFMASLLLCNLAQAQITITSGSPSYTQNFSTLAQSGAANTWTNNTTLSGWFLFNKTPAAIITYGAETGSTGNATYNSYGAAANSERALGSVGSGGAYWTAPASGAVAGYMALAFTNSSGGTINTVSLTFDGEQWRNGGNATAQTMGVQYGFGASFTAVTTWTGAGTAFNFTSPVATATAAAVNGNVAGKVTGLGGSLTSLGWADGTTLWFRWVETNDAGNDHGLAIDDVSFTATIPPAISNTSDIIANTGFLYVSNINYTTYQGATLTTGNSVEVGQFDIRDGGGAADGDALTTILTNISLNVANSSSLRRIAIFDGSINVGEVAGGATASFSGLNLAATDDGTKTFSVRVSFLSSVTDNQQFSFTVSSATANGAGSGFAAGNAGGAATSTAGDNNKIEVTASDLIFDVDPSTVAVSSIMTPSPTIVAVDANANTDLDFTGTVSLTTTGTFDGGATTSEAAINGTATFDNLIFSAEGTGVTIEGSATGVNATGNSVAFNVTNPQPDINVQQAGNDILSGGSYGFTSQVSGTSSSAITFTIQNVGSAVLNLDGSPDKVNISGANANQFSVNETSTAATVGVAGSTTFTITFSPTSAGAKTATISIDNNDTNGGEDPYTFTINGTSIGSTSAVIANTVGYVYSSDIAYASFQAASGLTTGTSVGVQGITYSDGADADNLPTIITQINYVINGSAAIRTAALFDGASNVAEVAVNGAASFAFSGLNISVADEGFKDLELRVTYLATVTDNNQPEFVVVNTLSDPSGTSFLPFDPEGTFSSTAGDINRIEVTATGLAFVQQPTTTAINVAMAPPVTVSANDGLGNRDLDFVEQVRITSNGTLSGSAVDIAAAAGLATFSSLTHTATGDDFTLNAERTNTLDWDIASNTFDITLVSAATDYFRSNVTVSGAWSDAASWQSSPDGNDPWINATLVPDSIANTITIRNGDTVNITSAVSADQIVIQNGGSLAARAAGTFTLRNGTGDDITVENGGTLVYNKATTPVVFSTATTTIRISTGGILSAQASGITANGSGVHTANHIYENASILEWRLAGGTPSGSGVTYFPNANAATVPILRFSSTTGGAVGGGTATVVNGKLEVATGITISFTGTGAKTFRNGIIGAGNVIQVAGTTGQLVISGAVAELGGAGSITLATNGLSIGAASTTSLSSNKTIAGTGTTNIAGVLNLNGFTLTSVAIAGSGTISGSAASGMVLNATSTLNFTPGFRTLKDLTVNTGTATLGTALDITAGASANTAGTVTVAPGATLATAGNLTLRSNEFGTARIGTGSAGGNYITGNVTVERYLPNNGFRSWRLLSVPTTTSQTIRQAWQEGDVNPLPKDNNLANRGTQITGVFNTQAAAVAAGFDSTSVQAAMLRWNGTGWSNITSTNQPINNFSSYFLYVRGDRSQTVTGSINNASATTLRTTGTVYTGDQVVTVPASSFTLVPNLHASAIDFSGLTRTGVNNSFYIWDSKRQSGSSLGSYQTFSGTNGYLCMLSGGSYTLGQPNTTIESGQSFFVSGGAGGSITLNESAKIAGGANLGFRPVTPANRLVKIDSRLYAGNEVADANVAVFDNAYPATVGNEDALKFTNIGVNFAITRDSKKLAIEGRPVISESDVIQFNMWNLKQQQYHFEFVPSNMGSQQLEAVLEDSYLHTSTPVSLSENTAVNFVVDANPTSSAANRFRIVLTKARPLPAITKTGIAVSPNPVEGRIVNLLFKNQEAGKYSVRLVNISGQSIFAKTIAHTGGSNTQLVSLPQGLAAGTYKVEIISSGKTKTIQTVLVK